MVNVMHEGSLKLFSAATESALNLVAKEGGVNGVVGKLQCTVSQCRGGGTKRF